MEAVRSMDIEDPDPAARHQGQDDAGSSDGYPIEAMQIMRFEGENWKLQGEVIQAKR